jgi:predicted permease
LTFLVAAVIAVSLAAGIAAEPRLPDGGRPIARRIAWLLFYFGTPFVAFFAIARLEITAGVGVGLVLGYVSLATAGLLAWFAGSRLLGLTGPSLGALIVVVIIANTGFVGVPLAGAVFGSDAIGVAIAFDTIVSGPMFYVVAIAVAAALGSAVTPTRRARVAAMLRNPPLLAVVAGLLAPDVLAPDVLVDTAYVLVYVSVPVAFFMVGLTLGSEAERGILRFPPALSAPVAVALALRLVVAPLLMIGLSALVLDVPDTYLLMAAMPGGVSSVIVAHTYGLDLKLTASAVAWSTMLVVIAGMIVPSVL